MFCRICQNENNLKFTETELRKEIKNQRSIGQQVIGNICLDCDYRVQNFPNLQDSDDDIDVVGEGGGSQGMPTPPERKNAKNMKSSNEDSVAEPGNNESNKVDIVDLSYDSDGEKENNNNNAWDRSKKKKKKNQNFDESNFRIVGCFVLSSESESESDTEVDINECHVDIKQTNDLMENNTPPPTPTIGLLPPSSPSSLESLKSEEGKLSKKTSSIRGNTEHKISTMEKRSAPFIVYNCPDCNLRFPDQQTLKVHSQIHSADSIKCPCCDLMFTVPLRLVSHMRRKHLSYEGSILNERPRHSSDGAMTIRLRYEQQETFYECQLCGRIDDVYKTHKDHVTSSHPYESKSLRTNKKIKTKRKLSSEEETKSLEDFKEKTHDLKGENDMTLADYKKLLKQGKVDEVGLAIEEENPKNRKSKDKSLSCPICSKNCGLERFGLCRHILSNHLLDEYKSHLREVTPESCRSKITRMKTIKDTAILYKFKKLHSVYFQCTSCKNLSKDCVEHLKHLKIHKNEIKEEKNKIMENKKKKVNDNKNIPKAMKPKRQQSSSMQKGKNSLEETQTLVSKLSSHPIKKNMIKKDTSPSSKGKSLVNPKDLRKLTKNNKNKEVEKEEEEEENKSYLEDSSPEDKSLLSGLENFLSNKKRQIDLKHLNEDEIPSDNDLSEKFSISSSKNKNKKSIKPEKSNTSNKKFKANTASKKMKIPKEEEPKKSVAQLGATLQNKRLSSIMKGGKITKKAVMSGLIKVKVKPPIKTVHLKERSCKFCNFISNSFMAFNKHMIREHLAEEFPKCNICNKTFLNRCKKQHDCTKSLNIKQRRKPSQVENFEENKDNSALNSPQSEKHDRKCLEEANSFCFKCGSLFIDSKEYQEHLDTDHLDSDPFCFRLSETKKPFPLQNESEN